MPIQPRLQRAIVEGLTLSFQHVLDLEPLRSNKSLESFGIILSSRRLHPPSERWLDSARPEGSSIGKAPITFKLNTKCLKVFGGSGFPRQPQKTQNTFQDTVQEASTNYLNPLENAPKINPIIGK